MDESRIRQLVGALVVGADELTRIAVVATRNKQGIAGSGRYANRFHEEVIKLSRVEKAIAPVLQAIPNFDPAPLLNHLTAAKSTETRLAARNEARRKVRMI